MKSQHVHKLKRLTYKSGNTIFFCTLPDCLYKTNIALALGKRSTCWRCGEPFIMNEYSLRLSKPHCDNCHRPKGIQEPIDEILIPSFPENRSLKQGEIPPLSLAERLQQTLRQAQPEEDEL